MTTISIIGAGPAGLMAAIHAAAHPAPTRVLEANAGPGRKLRLTGGGRCNFTHAGAPEEIARAFGKAGRFLRHALYDLSPQDVREFFRARGVAGTVSGAGVGGASCASNVSKSCSCLGSSFSADRPNSRRSRY